MPTHNRLDKIAFGAGRKRKEENYWLNRLSGELERCCFNDDHKKTNEDESNEPKHRSIRQLEFNINGDLYLKLIKLSAGSLPRLHMILTTGLIILINRYTGIEDVIIGAPIYKQEIETEFVNTILVLRNRLTPRMSFKELLLQVRQTLNETVENQNYPIEMILDKLKIPYNIAEDFPLFDIAVLLENIHEAKYLQHIHLNMIFSFKKTPESIAGKIEYNESSYEKTTIEQIITHFNLLLSRALLDLDQTINQFELFTEEEKIKLLSFCNTQVDFPENKTIYHFFEDQVKKNPDHISIFGLSLLEEAYLQISYRELNEKSNRLALWLEQGNVGPDTIVGVLLNRSVEMITAIFGIEKAGAAYLPIDPNYPPGRIDYMLKDSNAKIVLTADELRDCSRNALHYPGHNEFGSYDHRSSSSLAYVIYTSGTTGKPKGAGIENRSLVNRLHWMQKKYRLDSRDIILHKTPFTFDVSVWEIFWWSMAGASVCLLKPGSEKDPAMIIQTIEKYGVTVMHFVPSMLSVFLDYIKNSVNVKKLAGLKQVIASGEALPISLVNLFNRLLYIENGTRLSNLYGPTEATIDVTCFDCSTGETLKRIPIGKPIDNITLYILGKNLHLQPLGAAGELCIGGVGLGRGYLNRSELTAEKFTTFHHSSFDIPRIHHLKLYRTGDLARWLPDGNIEYLGRIDFQVKIRGFRIELGEIENQLALHKGIKEAVVIARENANNDKYLCAYVVLDNMYSFVHLEEDLHEYLSKDLPNFMVPQHFVVLERIPLTANGKIDRRALPEPGSHQSRQYVEPVTDTQKKLVQIWSEVLGLEKIGINENYFRIGGDSITAIKLASFINKRMNTHMMVMDLYSNETIEKLAFIIEQSQLQGSNEELALAQQEVEELKNRIIAENALTPMDPNIEDIFPMCDIEKGMTFYTLTDSDVAMYHDQFIYQIKYTNFDILRLKKALTLLVAKHEMLRTAFNLGDYEEPVHILYKNIQIDFMDFDISKMEKLSQEMYIRNFIEEDRRIPFNIMKAPLWRIRTFILNQNYICVLWIFHHAILDGWSVASLMTELNNTYLELKATPHYFPQKLNSTYKHFVIEQIVEKKKDDVRNYWQGELEDYKRLDFSGLKNDNDTPAIKRVRHKYGNAMLQKLSGTAEIYNTSVKHLCLGAYIYMLNMISYEDDIVVGLVTNNRPIREDSEKMLGCFLNTIPIRFKVPDSATYIEYIRLIDAKIVELKKYERLSLFEILRTIGEISQNKNPIFDTIFSFIDFHVYELLELDNKETSGDGDGLSLEGYERTNTLFDFIVSTTGGVFNISMAYANTLISNHSAARLLRYFENILEKMSKEPDRLMDKNEIIPLEEKEQILANFNDTTDEFPLSKGIHQLFAAQAGRTPDNVAVIGSSIIRPNEKPSLKIQLTYHELDEMSVHLATWLNYQGMKTGNIIGIMMERSPEIIIGVMGILKGGCAYLPIDANYPQERIDYMLKDSNAKMLVSNSIFQDVMKNYTGINRYDLPGTGDSLTFQSANPAYVIYTSGSTGNPKGVVIEHNSIVNYIHWAARHYVKYDEIHFPLFTSMSFDLTLTSIFVPLITGNKIVVYGDDDIWDIIREIVDDNHAGAVKLTPSHLQILRVKDIPASGSHIKRLILGGEMLDTPLTQEIYRHFNKKVEIYNEYGPTEATVGCMIYQFNEQTDINPYIPIGKPAANCQIYLLDKNKKIVPPGGLGEIYIGGAGIARGYLNRIELTAEKFIHLSMDQKNVTLYKTGDLARWRPDWNLDFLGRSDQQVKVRGYRIELGEIENALLKHQGVK
ncbi:MAG TPA: amino acid adenylation domain-containing protein, partial [Candidatus Kapabacteria bacterium]|nr:amino acid adenylation domain-containing protein [Candidatus Kapabacteria bacterium]